MAKIIIKKIKLYAHHGCFQEEAKHGGIYFVDISIDADLSKPSRTDKLTDTIDYCNVYEIVKKEMSVRSHLIEHVAQRIIDSLKIKFPQTKSIEVKVTKLNPQISGEVKNVSVIITSP